jgi:anti-anti-sigma factor
VPPPEIVDSPTGLRPGDHVSWTYRDADGFTAAVLPFLDEGRLLDEQLLLIGTSRPALLDALTDLPRRDELLADGRLVVRTPDDASCGHGEVGARDPLDACRDEVTAALSRGRTGLRVAADVTPLAGAGPRARARLHVSELRADALIGTTAMTALCLYDVSLGEDVLAPIRALHPFRHHRGPEPLAHLSGRGATLSLQGELDVTQAEDVCRALVDVASAEPGEVVLDLAGLAFLDVAGARALAVATQELGAMGVRLRLVGARRLIRRCLGLFGLPDGPA